MSSRFYNVKCVSTLKLSKLLFKYRFSNMQHIFPFILQYDQSRHCKLIFLCERKYVKHNICLFNDLALKMAAVVMKVAKVTHLHKYNL